MAGSRSEVRPDMHANSMLLGVAIQPHQQIIVEAEQQAVVKVSGVPRLSDSVSWLSVSGVGPKGSGPPISA